MMKLIFAIIFAIYLTLGSANSAIASIWQFSIKDLITGGKIYKRNADSTSVVGSDSCYLTGTSGQNCSSIAGEPFMLLLDNTRFGNLYTNQTNGVMLGFIDGAQQVSTYCTSTITNATKDTTLSTILGPRITGNLPDYADYSVFLGNTYGSPLACNLSQAPVNLAQLSWIQSRTMKINTNNQTQYNNYTPIIFKILPLQCTAETLSGVSWPATTVAPAAGSTTTVTLGVGASCATNRFSDGATTRVCRSLGNGTAAWDAVSGPGCSKRCSSFTTSSATFPTMSIGGSATYHSGSSNICTDATQMLVKSANMQCLDPGGDSAGRHHFYSNSGAFLISTDGTDNIATVQSYAYCKPYLSTGSSWVYTIDVTDFDYGISYDNSYGSIAFSYNAANPLSVSDQPNSGDRILRWNNQANNSGHMDLSGVDVRWYPTNGGTMLFDRTQVQTSFNPGLNSRDFIIMSSQRVSSMSGANTFLTVASNNNLEAGFNLSYQDASNIKVGYSYMGESYHSTNFCSVSNEKDVYPLTQIQNGFLTGLKDNSANYMMYNYSNSYYQPSYDWASPVERLGSGYLAKPINPDYPNPVVDKCNWFTPAEMGVRPSNFIRIGSANATINFHSILGITTTQTPPFTIYNDANYFGNKCNSAAAPQTAGSPSCWKNGVQLERKKVGDYYYMLNIRDGWKSTFGYTDNYGSREIWCYNWFGSKKCTGSQ